VTAAAPLNRCFALLDRDGTIIIDKIYLSDPKPALGMVLDAMADFDFAREDAVLIGDGNADMGAAAARGVKGVRVARISSRRRGRRSTIFEDGNP